MINMRLTRNMAHLSCKVYANIWMNNKFLPFDNYERYLPIDSRFFCNRNTSTTNRGTKESRVRNSIDTSRKKTNSGNNKMFFECSCCSQHNFKRIKLLNRFKMFK
jgi:hypothetical protein